LARFRFEDDKVVDLKDLFVAEAVNDNTVHFGSRIEFTKDGHIFMTIGDRDDRHKAQSLNNHHGKVLRLDLEGRAAKGNPFEKTKGAKPEIWSYGHRNPQGLVMNPVTGDLFAAEFGPRGGDELNLIQAGKNYGWPVVTFGREYWGPKIGEGTTKAGIENPIEHWAPSISPSAVAVYTASKMKEWQGNIFLGCLSSAHLRRLVLENGKVVKQEELFKDKGWRIRNVKISQDGDLYFSTDSGQLVKVTN
jgi:aldose sugar dehydrogenase